MNELPEVSFNRLEHYVPVAPFRIIWAIRHSWDVASAGPFWDLHAAMSVKIRIGNALNHHGTWQAFYMVDDVNTIIAGYFCHPERREAAVPPLVLKPERFLDPDEERAYEQWRATMTRIADEVALAEIEEGLS